MIHPPATIDPSARIGHGCNIWHNVHIREHALIGNNCTIGKDAYIDHHVVVGDNCRIQNQTSIYFDTSIEEGVFIGPHVCFINDTHPRSIKLNGSRITEEDWKPGAIYVKKGASIGAGCVILTGKTIGRWAMVGAGSLLTKDVGDYELVFGNPARKIGYVCPCGHRLIKNKNDYFACSQCGFELHMET